MLIYKYRPINKNTINSIINHCIHFSNPKDFNDPFDTKIRANFNGANAELVKRVKQLNGLFLPDFVFDENYKNEEYLQEAIKQINEQNSDHYFIHSCICCFSKTNQNILMWSHYADSHKGIAIGYEASDPKVENTGWYYFLNTEDERFKDSFSKNNEGIDCIPVWPVIYSSKKPDTIKVSEDSWDMFTKLRTKSNQWEYEQELRSVFLNPIGRMDVVLKKDVLKEIVFGTSASKEDIQLIISICRQFYSKDVGYYRTKQVDDEYKLVIEKINA